MKTRILSQHTDPNGNPRFTVIFKGGHNSHDIFRKTMAPIEGSTSEEIPDQKHFSDLTLGEQKPEKVFAADVQLEHFHLRTNSVVMTRELPPAEPVSSGIIRRKTPAPVEDAAE